MRPPPSPATSVRKANPPRSKRFLLASAAPLKPEARTADRSTTSVMVALICKLSHLRRKRVDAGARARSGLVRAHPLPVLRGGALQQDGGAGRCGEGAARGIGPLGARGACGNP